MYGPAPKGDDASHKTEVTGAVTEYLVDAIFKIDAEGRFWRYRNLGNVGGYVFQHVDTGRALIHVYGHVFQISVGR